VGCHPRIAEAVRACHAGWLADPDFDASTTTSAELMRQCSDAEVVASAWDAFCLAPGAPRSVCGESLEAFAVEHLVLCRKRIWVSVSRSGRVRSAGSDVLAPAGWRVTPECRSSSRRRRLAGPKQYFEAQLRSAEW
jgi:hypothetical protein